MGFVGGPSDHNNTCVYREPGYRIRRGGRPSSSGHLTQTPVLFCPLTSHHFSYFLPLLFSHNLTLFCFISDGHFPTATLYHTVISSHCHNLTSIFKVNVSISACPLHSKGVQVGVFIEKTQIILKNFVTLDQIKK